MSEETEHASTEDFYNEISLLYKERWTKVYGLPEDMYYPVQAPLSSKRKGDLWEKMYKNRCVGLEERLDRWHDATVSILLESSQNLVGRKVEIKYTCLAKPDSAKDIDSRGYPLEPGHRAKRIQKDLEGNPIFISGGSFQQIHPENADYGLFSAVCANGAFHYWVPYHLISKTAGVDNAEPGKIPLQSMHHGATVEGQIGRPEKFHNLFLLDVTFDTPFITDLTKYDLSKYENLVY